MSDNIHFKNAFHVQHKDWNAHLKAGDRVVDATLGAGHDTFALAKILSGQGKITAYDIQNEALERSQKLFEELTKHERSVITLKQMSHSPIVENDLALVVYNLGYLPGGDKSLTTRVETTLSSVKSALKALNEQGMLDIMCYPGHPEGAREEAALIDFFEKLEKTWEVSYRRLLNRTKAPSRIIVKRSFGI